MSGECTVTPGKILTPTEAIDNTKANQLGQPVVRVNAASIGNRELDTTTKGAVANALATPFKNLFCNGDFSAWTFTDDRALAAVLGPGVVGSGVHKHEYASANRWVTPNDANRTVTRVAFTPGQSAVPDSPDFYLHYVQSAPVSGINPAYVGQRIERVNGLSGQTVTFAIWVRSQSIVTVIPSLRQYFGVGGSAEVVSDGTPVTLAANTWTQIKQTFNIPSVSGKTIVTPLNFTEFRIVVPQGMTFTLDFAQAQVVAGGVLGGWDTRLPHEDLLFGWRYFQIIGFVFSNNIGVWLPFVNLRVPMLPSLYRAMVTLASAGAGGTVGVGAVYDNMILQTGNHSVISGGYVMVDGEMHAST